MTWWVPMPPDEPDSFWGARAAPRLPRWTERGFFAGRPRPGGPTFLAWAPMRLWRFAAVLLGLGFWGVFADQLYLTFLILGVTTGYSFVLQLVVGAPVFEELFKFGLALLLAAPLGAARGPLRVPVWVARGALGLAAGFAFGWFEHWSSYPDEAVDFRVAGMFDIYWREVFHAGSTLLSTSVFTALEPVAERRVRWFATLPSSAIHYANNALAIPVTLALGEAGGSALSLGLTALLWLAVLTVPFLAPAVRRVAEREAAKRFPAAPAEPTAPAAAAREAAGAPGTP